MTPAPTNKPTATKRARPVKYSDKLGTAILDRLAAGESLRAICRDEGMPAFQTVLVWVNRDDDFAKRYAVATDCRAQMLCDEMLEIADKTLPGVRVKNGPDGRETVISDQVERAKLQVHARQWTLARMAPKRFGNRVLNEITGADGGPVEVAQQGRPAEDVAKFSNQMFAAFQSHREPNGAAAQLDVNAIASISECVASFATGEEGDPGEAASLGSTFARIWIIRNRDKSPQSV